MKKIKKLFIIFCLVTTLIAYYPYSKSIIKVKENKGSVYTIKENDLKIIDDILIVNKSFPLPPSYVPIDTYEDISNKDASPFGIVKEAYNKFKEMQADIEVLGLNIWIQSGYRSYNFQNIIYNDYVAKDGQEKADTYSARPGYSEHQTGLAIDLNSVTSDFAETPEFTWINNNAYRYGFILRYPSGKEHITGYKYEPWHLRYVGEELANKLYNNGNWITLEEYYDLPSTYNE